MTRSESEAVDEAERPARPQVTLTVTERHRAEPLSGSADVLDRLEWQKIVFSERLSRFSLLRLMDAAGKGTIRVHAHRNHGFEQIASVLRVFTSYAGMTADVMIGDYDDSLTGSSEAGDLHLIWIDFDRYPSMSDQDLAAWLCERLTGLREARQAPFVVANAPGRDARAQSVNAALRRWCEETPGSAILPISDIAARLGATFFDEPRSAITGTRYADAACLEVARELGLKLIPSLLGAPVKAVAVDLDNTIYDGVLAEDGARGVRLTSAHRDIQAALVELAGKGVLLVICSRNEGDDVARLFRERTDFPLQAGHVAVWQVSWDSKADGIARAAATLNIASDAILMLDDNLGELAAATRAHPGMKLLFAGHSPQHTVEALRRFPGLWPMQTTNTDLLRNADIRANRQRAEAVAAAADETSYLRSLGVSLLFRIDPPDELQRLHDLSLKTNQFNLSLSRPSLAEVAGYLGQPDRRVVIISLRDKLADSGSVGSLLLRHDGDRLVVEELCISCRALGRHLETLMILGALLHASSERPVTSVSFRYSTGPRNQAALKWLSAYAGRDLEGPDGIASVDWDRGSAERTIAAAPVTVEWRSHA